MTDACSQAATKAQALALIRAAKQPVEPGHPCTIALFRPGDGLGVAMLFEAIYGELYPVDMYYIPAEIERANATGQVITAVARLADGSIIAQAALYRSSPPNPHLYEFGQMITLPEYRSGRTMFRLVELLIGELGSRPELGGSYGECVTSHTITQRYGQRFGYADTALEPALMPAGAYAGEGQADRRVGCLLNFNVRGGQGRTICLPGAYADQARAILAGAGLERTLEVASEAPALYGPSLLDTRAFDLAGVIRCQARRVGADFAELIGALETRARSGNFALLQCFVALGDPAGAAGVELLRRRGWFMGGLAPIWFGADGWLMQKLSVPPDFGEMALHTPKARALLEMVREDYSMSRSENPSR